jgi:aryl-alcohol dehydrogenase-like predicted oxidoreductase
LKAQGKVRAVGLSNHNIAQLETAERIGHVDTLQPPFSAIRREFAAAELPWCRERETGVIVYSPMQAGLLTGVFSEARAKTLPPDDWRSRNDEFTGGKLKRNLKLAATMKAVAERHGTTAASVAAAWTLAWAGSDRRHRGRTSARADRRPDRRCHAHPYPRQSRRDRSHDQGHGRG